MTTCTELAKNILPSQGFVTRALDNHPDWLLFEDPAIAGVIIEFPNVAGLLKEWESSQNSFLHLHQGRLTKASYKAWNLYTVLVTSDVNESLESEALSIEDNFVATRKLVGLGI